MATNPQQPGSRPPQDTLSNPVDPAAHDSAPTLDASPPGAAGPGAPILLTPGTRPLPEYELVRLLGRGGFGEVWQATGPGGFDVALKFLRLAEQTGQVEMRALELMKKIRHPHLLPMFGAWQRDGLLII